MKKHDIIVTTSNSIENTTILRYLEPISVNIVLGTNTFADMGASLVDLFGGRYNTYQKQLDQLYLDAIREIKHKAIKTRANAIIGFKVDLEEISGKGKAMFMISAVGTPVILSDSKSILSNQLEESGTTAKKYVTDDEIEVMRVMQQLENSPTHKILLENSIWYFLVDNPMASIAEKLLNLFYARLKSLKESDIVYIKFNISNYFKRIDSEKASRILYHKLENTTHPDYIIFILTKCKLFSAIEVERLIDSNPRLAIDCLAIEKETYMQEDILCMESIIHKLENIPDKGHIKFGDSHSYTCPNGHINEVLIEYCPKCNLNIKGLTQDEAEKIAAFKVKVGHLNELMNY